MKIKDMPWWNRPGFRLKKKGASNLNEAELLAIILERGNYKENAIDLANRLLKRYNFNKLADLSLIELKKELKDEVKAMKILAMFEIFKKTNRLKRYGFKPTIECAKDVYNHFVDELKDKKKEYLYALFLDSKNRIIGEHFISVGTLDSSLVHPREVFKEAIKNSAAGIILVHNHPSGDCEASNQDITITQRIKEAGKLMNIEIIDHIIIGKENYFSFRDKLMIN